jgi:hypothetical protein
MNEELSYDTNEKIAFARQVTPTSPRLENHLELISSAADIFLSDDASESLHSEE